MGSSQSKELNSLYHEVRIVVGEYRALRESRAENAIRSLHIAWSGKRRSKGLTVEVGPQLLVMTPGGWVTQKVIDREYKADDLQELHHAQFVSEKDIPMVRYEWEFDKTPITDFHTRETEVLHKLLVVSADPQHQITCFLYKKELHKDLEQVEEPYVTGRNDWQVKPHEKSSLESKLFRLVEDHLPFPLY